MKTKLARSPLGRSADPPALVILLGQKPGLDQQINEPIRNTVGSALALNRFERLENSETPRWSSYRQDGLTLQSRAFSVQANVLSSLAQ